MDAARKRDPIETNDPDGAGGWVTLQKASKTLGLGREGVLMLGIEGKLTIERREQWVFVSLASIAQYQKSPEGRRAALSVK